MQSFEGWTNMEHNGLIFPHCSFIAMPTGPTTLLRRRINVIDVDPASQQRPVPGGWGDVDSTSGGRFIHNLV